jgi:AAA domain/Bifunctional DNA primase/polymerase, N-terminal
VSDPTGIFEWARSRAKRGGRGDDACAYGREGLDVFPVNPTDKTPLASQYSATTDVEQIAEWWARWPTALIGHRIGVDYVLLDIDPRHGGLNVYRALQAAVGDDWTVTRRHLTGRGDGGFHDWWLRPEERLTTTVLNDWARKLGLGHELPNGRWSAGIDLLHHDHRYTILPRSPHPATGQPYTWAGAGLDDVVAPMPVLLAELVSDNKPPTPPRPPRDPDPDSIADWFSAHHTWPQVLEPHGWTLRAGDGDGSRWQHPAATNPYSATIRHGCLFVYSPNTPFEETAPSEPHGYTRFHAYAVLDHDGDLSAAARAARELKGDDGSARLFDAHQRQPDHPTAGTQPKPKRLTIVKASTIGIDRPCWVDDRRIPIGGVTLMVGREGMGKTAYACWLAARITRGELPGEWVGEAREVIYIGHEDDRRTVLNPRLKAAGADLNHFGFVDAAGLPFTIATDADELAAELADRAVALVIIDPLDSHLGAGIDSHKKAEVQATIEHMARFAQRLRCGVLGLGHLNKAPIRDLLAKVVGSVGFTTSVRSVLAIGEHPDDAADTLCVLAKANMTDRRSVPAVRFRVRQAFVPHPDGSVAIDTARVEIVGEEPGIDANALLGIDPESRSKVAVAYDWLGAALADGPVEWSALKAAADGHGITKWALHTARKRYGESLIIEERRTDKGRSTQWRLGGHPVEAGPDDLPIPSDQEKRPSAGGVIRSLQRPDDPPNKAPFATSRPAPPGASTTPAATPTTDPDPTRKARNCDSCRRRPPQQRPSHRRRRHARPPARRCPHTRHGLRQRHLVEALALRPARGHRPRPVRRLHRPALPGCQLRCRRVRPALQTGRYSGARGL